MTDRITLSLLAAVLLAACSSLSAANDEDVTALIAEPTESSRAALRQAVKTAFNGMDIMLADDALTRTSLLTIERRPIFDKQGNRIMGRDLSRPHIFRLVKSGDDCVLVRVPDDRRWVLADTRCVAE